IIYTSGSTGRPKGVAIRHKSAAVMVDWAIEEFGKERLAGVLASTSICFDLSVYEIFAPLSCGGRVVLADSALAISDLPFPDEVTLINTVPSAMAALLKDLPASVRTVNLAGEALKRSLVDDVYEMTGAEEVYNLYGPSEDTTYSTFALIPRHQAGNPVIGRPLANTSVYILDEDLNLAPVGAAAGLYIAGDGLARGYFNLPDMTAEKFIPNPYSRSEGERLYRTGDNARFASDGDIEFLGRSDHQVKMRGFRIELSEIESLLSSHPAVEDCAVLMRQDAPGLDRLTAYLIFRHTEFSTLSSEKGGSGDESENEQQSTATAGLKAYLREKLPEYMVPSVFVVLDEFPRTPNGKVDRKGLPAPEFERESREDLVAPRTPLEEILVVIFSEALGVRSVSVNDNLFDIGGHSLLAAQVVSRIEEKLGVRVPLRQVFETPAAAELAKAVSDLQATPSNNITPITRVSLPDEDALLSRLGELSDQEAEALLADIEQRTNRAGAEHNR
ncbi:MAG: non-ribosomal peptide synthetase, partial [Blastocatellia bacterium]